MEQLVSHSQSNRQQHRGRGEPVHQHSGAGVALRFVKSSFQTTPTVSCSACKRGNAKRSLSARSSPHAPNKPRGFIGLNPTSARPVDDR